MSPTDALPAAWRSDPVLASNACTWAQVDVLGDDDAMLLVLAGDDGRRVLGRGEPLGQAALLAQVAADGRPVCWAYLTRDPRVPSALGTGWRLRGAWDWLCTRSPAAPAGAPVPPERLDPAVDAAAVRDCLAEANPGTRARPDDPQEAGWWGVRDGDRLVAVIGASWRGGPLDRPGSSSWHLHGLGVRPAYRRRGLGGRLTAAATAAGLSAGAAWVSLGVWADNDAALRLYRGLQFGTVARFDTYEPTTPERS